jgi:MATE family multidrug resistance protein
MRQSLYLCAVITLCGTAVLLLPGPLLRFAQVPQAMQAEVQSYLAVLALAFAPALLFRLFSTLNQSLGRPQLVTWLQIGALAVKVPLSVWLVGGGAGVPAMGVVGCAWATFVVNFLLLAAALVLLRTNALYRPFGLWQRMERPDWKRIREFLRMGLPGGLSYMVEVTSFTLMAVFIARLGTTAAAAHQIAASLSAVLYMVPLSLSIACSARVSFWIGRGDLAQARRLVGMGLGLMASLAISLAALLWLLHKQLPSLFSRNPEVASTAAALLLWVALYHVADAIQAMCAFLLRCYRVTLLPLFIYGAVLWGMGLTGGYWLTYVGWGEVGMLGLNWQATQSASSFWAAATLALTLVSLCFCGLLWRAVRRPVAALGA